LVAKLESVGITCDSDPGFTDIGGDVQAISCETADGNGYPVLRVATSETPDWDWGGTCAYAKDNSDNEPIVYGQNWHLDSIGTGDPSPEELASKLGGQVGTWLTAYCS
jgi:hypothetical protein